MEVAVANGKATPQACKEAAITEQTYCRWRREYEGLKLAQAKRLKKLEKANSRLKRVVAERSLEKQILREVAPGKLLSANRRRQAVTTAQQRHGLSERQACRLFGQWRGTQRHRPTDRDDEGPLTQALVALASQYGRYGYRGITALLRPAGWSVGHDRVERIWRREGLKVPKRQKPRGRLWLNDGSCMRLRPERTNHVWSYDFVSRAPMTGDPCGCSR